MTDPLFLGWTVTRAIPTEVWTGLVTGQYQLAGGVIRWARGTPHAGQIVRHLLPVGSQFIDAPLFTPLSGIPTLMNVYQSASNIELAIGATQHVLQIATGTMLLAGLNLAVTTVGFAVLNQKLQSLDKTLSDIQKDVKAIRTLLELEERAKLGAALRDLLHIADITNPDQRHTILFNTKNVLAPISLKYQELLASADTIETAMAYEEYFCLTSLAHARCLAELGIVGVARRELQETVRFWKEQAQRIVKDLLIGKHPERFLFSDFVQDAPIAVLSEWLDFAYGEERGYAWIDELRQKTNPWYAKSWINASPINFTPNEMNNERERVIPSARRLVARNNVLEGYTAQYELLAAHNLTPSLFEDKMAALAHDSAVDGYVILQPVEVANSRS
jgi:hypothetical protein